MKRIRMEVIFHVADSCKNHVFADRLLAHMRLFRDPEQSANRTHHYESCMIQAESKSWDEIAKAVR